MTRGYQFKLFIAKGTQPRKVDMDGIGSACGCGRSTGFVGSPAMRHDHFSLLIQVPPSRHATEAAIGGRKD